MRDLFITSAIFMNNLSLWIHVQDRNHYFCSLPPILCLSYCSPWACRTEARPPSSDEQVYRVGRAGPSDSPVLWSSLVADPAPSMPCSSDLCAGTESMPGMPSDHLLVQQQHPDFAALPRRQYCSHFLSCISLCIYVHPCSLFTCTANSCTKIGNVLQLHYVLKCLCLLCRPC